MMLLGFAAGIAGVGVGLSFGGLEIAAVGAFVGAGMFAVAHSITMLRPVAIANTCEADPAEKK